MGGPSLAELDRIATPLLSADKSLYLGPFVIATFIDTLFLGILLMQCGSYVTVGRNDCKLFKTMVSYIMLMNVAATVFTWAWIYDLFVYNFGSYGLFLSIKYLSWFYVLDSMMVVVVQIFFGLRAWKLMNKSWLIGGLILALLATEFGAGVAIKVLFTHYGSTLYAGKVRVPAYICLFCTVGADVIITMIILCYLWKNRVGNQPTDDLLGRLIRMTFSSQLPPTLIAIALAIEYSIRYDSFIAIPFICVQGKVYGISLLHTLNVREHWRRPSTTVAETGDIEFQQPSQPTMWRSNTYQHTRTDHSANWSTQKADVDDTLSTETVLMDNKARMFQLSRLSDALTSQAGSPREKKMAVDVVV
ncbi:transmembrane protein [Ceratobasidium sp. AG-Ba]|nr:transmembrane protein [Ceratobasidium sp. AG-Ba]